jgi:hypothetical protein
MTPMVMKSALMKETKTGHSPMAGISTIITKHIRGAFGTSMKEPVSALLEPTKETTADSMPKKPGVTFDETSLST